MPILPINVGTLASDVTDRARAILDDMLNDEAAGDIFADDAPRTIRFVNSAIDVLNRKFINTDVEFNTAEAYLYNLPPAYNPADPNSIVSISYVGCNDGYNNFVAPSLPSNLIMPLRLWARQSGTINAFLPLKGDDDGLSPRSTGYFSGISWEWRNNILYLNGNQIALDLRMRYIIKIPTISLLSEYIPVQNATEALAYLCAAKYEQSMGNALAQTFFDAADAEIESIINRSVRRKSRISHRRFWRF